MLTLSTALIAAACIPITAPRITAHDLSLADPRFSALPATEIVGFAPDPGVKRTFAIAELERFAAKRNLSTGALSEICFEVPSQPLTAVEMQSAMRSSLPPAADLQIVEAPVTNVPVGKLLFPLSGLEPPAQDGSQLWRGYVQYAQTRKLNVWARVRVTHRVEVAVALKDIPPNTPLTRDLILIESRSLPLTRELPAVDVAGKTTKQSLKAGAVVPASAIETSAQIKRGDAIPVEVQSGATRLLFHAVAEQPGREGELINLRNPVTGKIFRAKVTGTKAVIRL